MPTRRQLRHALGLAVACAALGATAAPAQAGPGFFVGVDEDAILWTDSQATASIARAAGVKAIRITVPWRPGQSRVPASFQERLDRVLVDAYGLRVVATVVGRAEDAPRTAETQQQYCDFAADLLRRNPTLSDVVVWNDPNDASFWSPQYGARNSSLAPAAYAALLARCWDALHAARPTANVVAVAVSKREDAVSAKRSHGLAAWWRLVGAAYKKSGRRLPLFDTVGHIAHPVTSAERPWARHTDALVGVGDYDRLTAALNRAFYRTRQPVPGRGTVSIWYLAQGFQTVPDAAKAGLYGGQEGDAAPIAAWSEAAASDTREGPGPDQATQLLDAIRIAACQRGVGAYFNFHLADESRLEGWQSGILWADWSVKPSYAAFRGVAADANAGVIDCGSFIRGVPPAVAHTQASVELTISDVRVAALTPYSATVTWRTSAPASGRAAFGLPSLGASLWSGQSVNTVEHRATVRGLRWGTTYRVWVRSFTPDGQRVQASLDLQTPWLPAAPVATLDRGSLLLDGSPFFPFIVWGQCPDVFGTNLAAGINLFADNPCGGLQTQLNALGGRALSAGVGGKDGGSGPGLIGYFHPDEPDGAGMTAAALPPAPAGAPNLRFLTLTNHFYSGAAPLPQGRGMYPALIAASDVVGFDLYPLQEWCRADRLGDVFSSQQELVRMSPQKATFQWIEVDSWRCPSGRTAVTPATVKAESWLAIAGGAHGLGFFPGVWPAHIGQAIAEVARDVASLGPALLAPAITAGSDNAHVKVGARSHEGVVYVIAVNAGFTATRATLRVGPLGDRPLTVVGQRRRVDASGSRFTDSFAPLAVHVYVAEPAGVGDPA
jgi:hypothetical protein